MFRLAPLFVDARRFVVPVPFLDDLSRRGVAGLLSLRRLTRVWAELALLLLLLRLRLL
jgi:hypothetical protein